MSSRAECSIGPGPAFADCPMPFTEVIVAANDPCERNVLGGYDDARTPPSACTSSDNVAPCPTEASPAPFLSCSTQQPCLWSTIKHPGTPQGVAGPNL